mmetsp:Transcript_12849/g.28987  ORF Transcript_12849/g.28987 Transcript_12849/m.28987 type:complete len:227 (-) Transcript_12849:56-736(-)
MASCKRAVPREQQRTRNQRFLAVLACGACCTLLPRLWPHGFVPEATNKDFLFSRRAALADGAYKLMLGTGAAAWPASQSPAGAAQQLPMPGGTDCTDCELGTGDGSAASSSVELQIRDIIKSHPVVMFSKTFCPFCFKAKAAFAAEGVQVKVVELDQLPAEQTQEFQQTLKQMTGARSVPRVFVNGVCIGGGDETEALWRSGALGQMLKSAPSSSAPALSQVSMLS